MTLPFSRRDFDGMTPSIAHADGKGMVDSLVEHLNDVRAKATISAGNSSVQVAVGSEYDGQPVLWDLLGAADATLTEKRTAEWDGNGNLTLTGNANATANVDVSYMVVGKSS